MKKFESRVQTQMKNTKCRIDYAKYNVKWNIEFWRKWNAIVFSCGMGKYAFPVNEVRLFKPEVSSHFRFQT